MNERNVSVAVVGGGNSAVEEAEFLTRFASSVTIIHRRDALRADKIVQDRAFENPKISFCWNSIVTEVVGEDKVTGLKLKNVKTGEESLMPIDGVFVFVGTKTVTDIFEGQLEIENGTVKVGPDMQTSARMFMPPANPSTAATVRSLSPLPSAPRQGSLYQKHTERSGGTVRPDLVCPG